jgi:glucose-6-phosphate isomerase, archaeal
MNDGGSGNMTTPTLEPAAEEAAGNPGDLRPWAGMEVTLQDGPLLAFGTHIVVPGLEQRTSAELAPVLLAPEAGREQDVIYTVYRGVGPKEMLPEIQRRGLVYVVLAMRPGTIGAEWVRTRGHTNPDARATSVAYPEVHEVWHGEGLLYLQNEVAAEVSDVVVIPLRAGEKAVVAPGWACLLANVGSGPLVVGSWRTADCIPQTDALTARGGMAHYVLPGAGPGAWAFEANPRYEHLSVPRTLTPQDLPDFGLKHNEPMLATFHTNPDFLRFLLRPQDYTDVWARVYGEDGRQTA